MFFDVQSYVLVVLYKQLPVVVSLYTEDDSCMAIETCVSRNNGPMKLSNHA